MARPRRFAPSKAPADPVTPDVLALDDTAPLSPLLRMHDVLRILNLRSRGTVYELAEAGYLPILRLGGAIRFRESDVRRLLRNGTGEAQPRV